MNESEFKNCIKEYSDYYFEEIQERSEKVILKWLWNDFFIETEDELIKIIKNVEDFIKFKKITEIDEIIIGILGKDTYRTLKFQIEKYIIIPFEIRRFLKFLGIKSSEIIKFEEIFNDYKFFSSFIRKYKLQKIPIVNLGDFLLEQHFDELFFSDYNNLKDLTIISKILFLLIDLRPSIADPFKTFFMHYIFQILEDNNLSIFKNIFSEVLNRELTKEFFFLLIYIINLMEGDYTRERCYQEIELKLETHEFNQFSFIREKKNELFKIAESFALLISNKRHQKIEVLIESLLELFQSNDNFKLNQNFQQKYSMDIYREKLIKLMQLSKDQGENFEKIAEVIKKNRNHIEYAELYEFILIYNNLNFRINNILENRQYIEDDILEIFELIHKFEDFHSKLVHLNIYNIFKEDTQLKKYIDFMKNQVKIFIEKVKNDDLGDISSLKRKMDDLNKLDWKYCTIIIKNFNYKFFNVISEYLKLQYLFKEEKIGIFTKPIDFNIKKNSKVILNPENFLFKIQNINKFANQNFTIVLNEEITLDFFKYNLLELLFTKIIDGFSTLIVLVHNEVFLNKDLNFFLIYRMERERVDLKINKLRIKDYSPKKIYTNNMENIEVTLLNPNKFPLMISEIVIIAKSQIIDTLKEIDIQAFKTYKLSFKLFYIEAGSSEITFRIIYQIYEGNKILHKQDIKRIINLIVETPLIEKQKKRSQDKFFDKFL